MTKKRLDAREWGFRGGVSLIQQVVAQVHTTIRELGDVRGQLDAALGSIEQAPGKGSPA